MKNYPYISIVVCAYNEEKIIGRCIDSLLRQSYPKDRYEIVLIDDGSEDKTAEISEIAVKLNGLRVPPDISYFRIEQSGISTARNTGVLKARGEMIAFIDADAVADEDWISEIRRAFEDSADIGVVGGKIETLNSDNRFSFFIHWINYYMEDKNGKEIIPIIGANMAFRREVFNSGRNVSGGSLVIDIYLSIFF